MWRGWNVAIPGPNYSLSWVIFSLLNGLSFPLLDHHPDKQKKRTKRRAVLLGASKAYSRVLSMENNLDLWISLFCHYRVYEIATSLEHGILGEI